MDLPPIQDLQESSLKGRFVVEAPSDDGSEPGTLAEVHEHVKPRWLRNLMRIALPPVGLLLAYFISTDQAQENNELALGLFGFIGACVVLHFFFIGRAYWRMEI